MTREEAWNRIDAIIEKHEVDDVYITITNHKDYDALRTAREALQQEPCTDAISRQAVLDLAKFDGRENLGSIIHAFDVEQLPPVNPIEKVGHWILVQRGKYVDVNCSECGFSRIKEFAYNYAVEDISEQEFRDFVEKNKMNFCECCGAKMEEVEK